LFPPPPTSTPFPYTTLFRSDLLCPHLRLGRRLGRGGERDGPEAQGAKRQGYWKAQPDHEPPSDRLRLVGKTRGTGSGLPGFSGSRNLDSFGTVDAFQGDSCPIEKYR